MTTCETLPLCPDTTVGADPVLTEPVEVGPFGEGIVFVRLVEPGADSAVNVEVGISPIGYEDWPGAWTALETRAGLGTAGMYAIRVSNFGNWLRLRLTNDGDPATVLAWFVGKG